MEERDFFEEICLISLYASKAVRFTAVVDSMGKLILGKFKKSIFTRSFVQGSFLFRTLDVE